MLFHFKEIHPFYFLSQKWAMPYAMTVNTTTVRIWSITLMPKNILRCSASLRIDGITKRLIAMDISVEIKGAIQRYFLFHKKKKITDIMGMIQNTEIFHQFINIPLPQKTKFLSCFSLFHHIWKTYTKQSFRILSNAFPQSKPPVERVVWPDPIRVYLLWWPPEGGIE